MMKVELTLAMIVKDEAHTIERTLRSALPFVDRWLIADTGSRDGTQEVVLETLQGIPGELMEYPWPGCFSTARNHVLDAAQPDQLLLWLDADDALVDGDSLRFMLSIAQPSIDCWSMRHEWSDGQAFLRPAVVRSNSGWRYKGRVHELLVRNDESVPAVLLGPSIRHTLTYESVRRSLARRPWDIEALEQMLVEDPTDERAREWLARST